VPEHVYAHAIRGFSAFMSEEDALAIAADPNVEYVEEDSIMEAIATQTNATWGIDRIDQRNRPLNATYSYTTTGSSVNAYVIDTGVRRTHSQFGGRAFHGFTAINDGRGSTDCNGHGTHVAGTIGGSTYGVAKAVRIFAVRVLSCSGSGSTSGVIAGVDWVRANRIRPAVANMSLGGGASSALDTAVNNSINSGVTYAIAAGNSNANAANFSPARVAAAITVGSSTSTDARSSFSNFGSVVDIFAPGSSITSAWSTSDTAIRTISGTSMATPHVAGVAARYLQANPGASPGTVRNALVNDSTVGILSGIPSGTANRLLFRSGAQ
jgi:subtilisin family serine protease